MALNLGGMENFEVKSARYTVPQAKNFFVNSWNQLFFGYKKLNLRRRRNFFGFWNLKVIFLLSFSILVPQVAPKTPKYPKWHRGLSPFPPGLSTTMDLDKVGPLITIFAKILRDSFVKSLSSSKRRLALSLPLLVCVPRLEVDETTEKPKRLMIYGCPPANQTSSNTLMPRLFETAASKAEIEFDTLGFDPSLIELDFADKIVFVETVTALVADIG